MQRHHIIPHNANVSRGRRKAKLHHSPHLVDHDVRHARERLVGGESTEKDTGGAERQAGGRADPRVQPDLVPYGAPDPLASSSLSIAPAKHGTTGYEKIDEQR